MRGVLVLLLGAILLGSVHAAQAARAPTRAEADAIFRAVQRHAPTMPIACLPLRIRISTSNRRYATVDERISCLRKGLWGEGLYLVRRVGATWRVVAEGTEFRCSAVPAAVRRDLKIPCY